MRTRITSVIALGATLAGCDMFLPTEGYLDQKCTSSGGCALSWLYCIEGLCQRLGESMDPCTPASGCAEGFYCYTGLCWAQGLEGRPCRAGGVCNATLECIGGKCTSTGGPSEPCRADGTCESSDLECRSDVCVAVGGAWEPCRTGGTCDTTLLCLAGQCVVPGTEGNPCLPDATCSATSVACVDGTCVAAGALGEPCRADGTCDTGLACWAGHCMIPGDRDGPCLQDGSCNWGSLACVSDTCLLAGDQGEPCRTDGSCDGFNVTCIAGTCLHVGDPGEPCFPSGQCGYGYTCVSGSCSDLTVWKASLNTTSGYELERIQVSPDRAWVVTALDTKYSWLYGMSDGVALGRSGTAAINVIWDAAVSNGATYFASASADGSARFFDGDTFELLASSSVSGGQATAVTFSPDVGDVAVAFSTSSSSYVSIFTTGGSWTHDTDFTPFGARVSALRYGPAGSSLLAAGGKDGTVALYSTSGGTYSPVSTTNPMHAGTGPVRALDFTSDASMVLVVTESPGMASLYALPSGSLVRSFSISGTYYYWYGGALSPDGTHVAAGGSDSLVRVWRVDDGTIIATYRADGGEVRGIEFAADGKSVVVGTSYGPLTRVLLPPSP